MTGVNFLPSGSAAAAGAAVDPSVGSGAAAGLAGTARVGLKPGHGCNVTGLSSGALAAAATYLNAKGLNVDPADLHSTSGNGFLTAWTSELRSGTVPDEFGTYDLSTHEAGREWLGGSAPGLGQRRAYGLGGGACGSVGSGSAGKYQRVSLGSGSGAFFEYPQQVSASDSTVLSFLYFTFLSFWK